MPYNNIIYATEQEARSYLIPYGTQMLFMDPTSPTFYVKTTDAFGSPSFDIYDFTQRSASSSNAETPLTRADLESLRAEILALITPQKEVPQNNANEPQSNNAQQ